MNALGAFLKAALPFEKWHGARNDFLFVARDDLFSALKSLNADPQSTVAAFAREACQRNTGLGADGLVVWNFSSQGVLSAGIWNSDGSRAGTCGNALRCLAALCLAHKLWNGQSSLPVAELDCSYPSPADSAGSIFATLIESRSINTDTGVFESVVEMGRVFETRQISSAAVTQAAFIGGTVAQELFLQSLAWVSYVQLANPHLVVGLKPGSFQRLTHEHFGELGSLLQTESVCLALDIPLSNIGFVELPSNEETTIGATAGPLPAIVFERGAGLTPCCGSGGCAMKVALDDKKHSQTEMPQSFSMPGGVISITRSADVLYLSGPAQWIVRGSFN